MGTRAWMLVSSDGSARERWATRPALDPMASLALAKVVFPGERFAPLGGSDLSAVNPPDDQVLVGSFDGVAVIAASEFAIDLPSRLSADLREKLPYRRIVLLVMNSGFDWLAFAAWEGGELQRALSLSPDSGILEDLGERYPFELPYWAGEHAVDDDEDDEKDRYPFVFHPIELGNAALAYFCGYVLESAAGADCVMRSDEIPLVALRRLH